MQLTCFGRAKSVAGGALVVLGIFVFYQNLHRAAAQLSHLPGNIPAKALGVVPTILLATARVLQEYAADHQRFLHVFLQHTLVVCGPLLLVMVGRALSRDTLMDHVNVLRKDCGCVDLAADRSTSK